jgi:radical SAM-linked protein
MQPEPLAPFIDAFFLGDAEHYLARFLEEHESCRQEGLDRLETLERLARLGGVYCPRLYDLETEECTGHLVVGKPNREGAPHPVQRKFVPDLGPHPFPSGGPVPSTEVVFDRFSVEVARGCTEGCRFCQAGIIYRPVRERSPEEILDTLGEAVREGGYDEVSLTALSTADFSCITPLVRTLMDRLTDEKVSLAVSSLRAYGLPEELLDAIAGVRATNLTLAPEAGSARLRDVINKNISPEDMERGAHAIFSRGWKRCKLYFMIGLPTEEDADVLEILTVARQYLEIGRRYHRGRACEITVSVSTHVPKPHTPFQWAAMDDIPGIQRKQRLLQQNGRDRGIQLKWHDAEASHLEGILARGDRRVGDWIEYAFRNGCRFDGWSGELRFEVWLRGLEELGIDRFRYLRELPLEARLPWDHIQPGVEPEFLRKEYLKALESRLSPPCGKPFGAQVHSTSLEEAEADARRLVCFNCGLDCDLDDMREQRKLFLRQLEASRGSGSAPPSKDEPQRPAGEPAKPSGAESSRPLPTGKRRPRPAIVNKASTRYRVLHTKLGRARLLSHLDLVRLLPRLFRRAGISLNYTLGFHPKPRMTFSPALTLGWGSRGELLDVFIEERPLAEELLDRLNRAAPEGLEFLEARPLGDRDPSISRVVNAADYGVRLPGGLEIGDRLEATIRELLSGAEVEICRVRAGGEDIVTLPSGAVLSATVDAETAVLLLGLRLDTSPVIRPDDLARHVLGVGVPPQAVERRALWCAGGRSGARVRPLDLEGLRAADR